MGLGFAFPVRPDTLRLPGPPLHRGVQPLTKGLLGTLAAKPRGRSDMTHPDDFSKVPPATVLVQPGRPAGPLAQRVLQAFERASPVVRQRMLSQLVVVAFQSASPAGRRHLLERLVRPLGLLSLAAVAGGTFAKIRLRSHWQDVQVQFDDVQNVRASDLGALVDHVQQVSVEAVAGVAQVIAASPWMTGSAVAAVLVTVLMRQASMLRSESLDD